MNKEQVILHGSDKSHRKPINKIKETSKNKYWLQCNQFCIISKLMVNNTKMIYKRISSPWIKNQKEMELQRLRKGREREWIKIEKIELRENGKVFNRWTTHWMINTERYFSMVILINIRVHKNGERYRLVGRSLRMRPHGIS